LHISGLATAGPILVGEAKPLGAVTAKQKLIREWNQ
jgi:hypothetical protein